MKPQTSLIEERDAEQKFKCAICYEIFVDPCRPPSCPHAFCKECLYNVHAQLGKCPICKLKFDFAKVVFDHALNDEMLNSTIECQVCTLKIKVTNLANHRILCNQNVTPKPAPSGATGLNQARLGQPKQQAKALPGQIAREQMVPNRFTFKCPYCDMENLTSEGLIDHCNQVHSDCRTQVVCPICKVMPWGDVNYKSVNFIRHLNIRHQFEYDKFVDLSLDDEESLSVALRNSLLIK